MSKKYEFTGETKQLTDKIVLKRIRRLSDGLIGGWIESEDNLSHKGSCFVYEEARVYNAAKVYGNAKIYRDAIVYEAAEIYGEARIHEDSRIFGEAKIYGNAEIYGSSLIYGNAEVYGNSMVYENAWIYGGAKISGHARIKGSAEIYGEAKIKGRAEVSGSATIYENAIVTKCIYTQQPKNDITITDNYIFIGCEGHTYAVWDNEINEIGKRNLYSRREISRTKKLLEILKLQLKEEL